MYIYIYIYIYIDIKNVRVSLQKEEKTLEVFRLGLNEVLSYELQNQTIQKQNH